jgi:hypothetical protein
MIGSIISTAKAFCLPSHYAWAAHERRGIGLTYYFGMGWLFALIYFSLLEYYGNASGFSLRTFLANYAQTMNNSFILHVLAVTTNSIVLYIFLGTMIAIGFTFSLINMAIIYSIYAQIFNFALNAKLDYCAVLRMTTYTLVVSVFVAGLLLRTLGEMGYNYMSPTLDGIVFFIIFTCYSVMAILSAKYSYY